EYLTSYIMEKLFKRRWWDYSNYFCNLNGRICFRNSLLFSFLVLLVIYILHPAVIFIVSKIESPYYYIVFGISLLGLITDITLSTIKSAKFSIILKKAELKFDEIKNGLNDKKLIKKLKSVKNRFPSMKIKLRKNNELKSTNEIMDELEKKD
ncbi:MAG: putative ABC transporter permease, partial [bacterium]|nr:putative ABC transporter permease [bacterium]